MFLNEFIDQLERYENPADIYVEYLSYGDNPLDGGSQLKILGMYEDAESNVRTLFITEG